MVFGVACGGRGGKERDIYREREERQTEVRAITKGQGQGHTHRGEREREKRKRERRREISPFVFFHLPNISRMILALSPMYLSTMALETTLRKEASMFVAIARARSVLPVPGGPYRRTP